MTDHVFNDDPTAPPDGYTIDSLFSGRSSLSPARQRVIARRRRQQKRTPFVDKKRSDRRDLFVRLGNQLRQDRQGGGVFSTHDLLPGHPHWPLAPGEPSPAQWADIYFRSRRFARDGWFYNATIFTLADRLVELVTDLVEDEVLKNLSAEEVRATRAQTFSRRLPNGGIEMTWSEEPRRAALGGLTLSGAKAQWLRDHWDSVHERIALPYQYNTDRAYAYGIGLYLCVAEPGLTADVIARAVHDYWGAGEPDHQAFATIDWSVQRPLLDRLLWAHVHRWDCAQARANGEKEPSLPEDLEKIMGYESMPVLIG